MFLKNVFISWKQFSSIMSLQKWLWAMTQSVDPHISLGIWVITYKVNCTLWYNFNRSVNYYNHQTSIHSFSNLVSTIRIQYTILTNETASFRQSSSFSGQLSKVVKISCTLFTHVPKVSAIMRVDCTIKVKNKLPNSWNKTEEKIKQSW